MKQKTRIVCTIGPTTCSEEALLGLYDRGMNVIRLNGSHNTKEWHREVIRRARNLLPNTPILLDLPGRKIRTTKLNLVHKFLANEEIILTTDPDTEDIGRVPVNYQYLHLDVKVGDKILADDGILEFSVKEISGQDIKLETKSAGELKSSKGINVPHVRVKTPLVNERDKELIQLCREERVDFVGVSFVESGEHLEEIKKHLIDSQIEIISKIENQYALDNLESILNASFGIMIDRGDLSAETNYYHISIKQKEILKIAKKSGVPVIVATEMLHSMIENWVPTKAEVNDITNAVLDGASAVMLSGETASGIYPFEAVKTMGMILLEAEQYLIQNDLAVEVYETSAYIPRVIGNCIKNACEQLEISKVICLTKTGYALKELTRHRLRQPIFVVTDNQSMVRKLSLHWGVYCYISSVVFTPENNNLIEIAIKELYLKDCLSPDDLILATAARYPHPLLKTKMNYLEIHAISDLEYVLGWDHK